MFAGASGRGRGASYVAGSNACATGLSSQYHPEIYCKTTKKQAEKQYFFRQNRPMNIFCIFPLGLSPAVCRAIISSVSALVWRRLAAGCILLTTGGLPPPRLCFPMLSPRFSRPLAAVVARRPSCGVAKALSSGGEGLRAVGQPRSSSISVAFVVHFGCVRFSFRARSFFISSAVDFHFERSRFSSRAHASRLFAAAPAQGGRVAVQFPVAVSPTGQLTRCQPPFALS